MNAAAPEEVDVVAALTGLQRLIGERCVQIMTGQGVTGEEWIALRDLLAEAGRLCQAQVVIEADEEA